MSITGPSSGTRIPSAFSTAAIVKGGAPTGRSISSSSSLVFSLLPFSPKVIPRRCLAQADRSRLIPSHPFTFAKDNCLFRSYQRDHIDVLRQAVLVGFLTLLFGVHLVLHPFIDRNSNASEFVSRSTYVAFAVIGLLVSLKVPGSAVLDNYIIYM